MMIVRPFFFGPTLKPLSAWFLVLWGRFIGPHVLHRINPNPNLNLRPGSKCIWDLPCHDLALECHSTPCWLRLIKVGSCQLAQRVDWSPSRCLHFFFWFGLVFFRMSEVWWLNRGTTRAVARNLEQTCCRQLKGFSGWSFCVGSYADDRSQDHRDLDPFGQQHGTHAIGR